MWRAGKLLSLFQQQTRFLKIQPAHPVIKILLDFS
jgi:hypothetical protein